MDGWITFTEDHEVFHHGLQGIHGTLNKTLKKIQKNPASGSKIGLLNRGLSSRL